jgi:hypothetical protein
LVIDTPNLATFGVSMVKFCFGNRDLPRPL